MSGRWNRANVPRHLPNLLSAGSFGSHVRGRTYENELQKKVKLEVRSLWRPEQGRCQRAVPSLAARHDGASWPIGTKSFTIGQLRPLGRSFDSMASPLSAPIKKTTNLKRVAILFAGGPAPAANAVISTAAAAFQRNDIEVLGIMHGYSHLADYSPEQPLEEGTHYVKLQSSLLKRSRNTQGIMIGTARTNPGKDISHPSPPGRSQAAPRRCGACMRRCCRSGVDALISIGGDDTLKTANKFKMFQDRLPAGAKRIPGRPPAEDDRQRLHGHRFHVRLLHGGGVPGRRDPQPAGRRRSQPGVFSDRDDGPQRGLAVVRRGDRRRSVAGHQRRGHHRQLPRTEKRTPTTRPARRKRTR